MREKILDAADARIRTSGYHGFSFRDVAADTGIKSASVHHHFPGKADLGTALAARYRKQVTESLGDPRLVTPDEARARVTGFFRSVLAADTMCLAGLLGAEQAGLPDGVRAELRSFFEAALGYLHAAFGTDWTGESPEAIIARHEGALMLARVMGDPEVFERAMKAGSPG